MKAKQSWNPRILKLIQHVLRFGLLLKSIFTATNCTVSSAYIHTAIDPFYVICKITLRLNLQPQSRLRSIHGSHSPYLLPSEEQPFSCVWARSWSFEFSSYAPKPGNELQPRNFMRSLIKIQLGICNLTMDRWMQKMEFLQMTRTRILFRPI